MWHSGAFRLLGHVVVSGYVSLFHDVARRGMHITVFGPSNPAVCNTLLAIFDCHEASNALLASDLDEVSSIRPRAVCCLNAPLLATPVFYFESHQPAGPPPAGYVLFGGTHHCAARCAGTGCIDGKNIFQQYGSCGHTTCSPSGLFFVGFFLTRLSLSLSSIKWKFSMSRFRLARG